MVLGLNRVSILSLMGECFAQKSFGFAAALQCKVDFLCKAMGEFIS
jgi:hypothetical protein